MAQREESASIPPLTIPLLNRDLRDRIDGLLIWLDQDPESRVDEIIEQVSLMQETMALIMEMADD